MAGSKNVTVSDSAEARDAMAPLAELATRLKWTGVPSMLELLVRRASTLRSHSLPERHTLRGRGFRAALGGALDIMVMARPDGP